MKIFLVIAPLLVLLFVTYSSAFIGVDQSNSNINDLRYPRPISFSNLTNTLPFRTLRAFLNLTNIDRLGERTKNVSNQMSAIVDLFRRVLRFMFRNSVQPTAGRTNDGTTTTEDWSDISLNLPIFNETETPENNSKSIVAKENDDFTNDL